MLYLSAISTTALELLKVLMSLNEFSALRLVGGTSLALQIGHRKSIDLDLFGKVDMEKLPMAEGIRLARQQDIAAMKIAAITGRGSKKDFIDLFFLLRKYKLTEIISFYNQKYFDASTYLAIKSLTYFDDAEQDVEPDMLTAIEWDEVKNTITGEVMAYTENYM